MNHSLYQDGILKVLPFKRLPWIREEDQSMTTLVEVEEWAGALEKLVASLASRFYREAGGVTSSEGMSRLVLDRTVQKRPDPTICCTAA
jgi:hypothetical protein